MPRKVAYAAALVILTYYPDVRNYFEKVNLTRSYAITQTCNSETNFFHRDCLYKIKFEISSCYRTAYEIDDEKLSIIRSISARTVYENDNDKLIIISSVSADITKKYHEFRIPTYYQNL